MMARQRAKVFVFTLIFVLLSQFLGQKDVHSSSEETITKRERDIILMMCALENPNYDIVLAIDVSGSMNKVLPEWRKMAEKTIDIAQNGDTLALIKFDASPRAPVVQEIRQDRDKELFKGVVRRTTTTTGWGTDVRRAYWLTLKTLKDFNEARKKKGEPVRLSQVVFISDGDDIPPENSPFRNPGSPETLELADLISDAQRTRIINILPIGMEFDNYVPRIRTIQKEGMTPGDEKINKELRAFMEKLQNLLNREYAHEIKDDQEKVPKAPYEFYIDWLSNRLELRKLEDKPARNPYRTSSDFELASGFRKVKVKDAKVKARYNGTGNGKASNTSLSSELVEPGASSKFSCEVRFPRNWSFKSREYKGELEVELSGSMEISHGETGSPGGSPTTSPSPVKKGLIYTYPFVPKKITVPLSGKLPPCIELFILTGGGGLAFLLAAILYIIKKALPLTITLKTDSKARAFRLTDGADITIGGSSDFELDGCQEPVAAIERKGRCFLLVPRKEGILADYPSGQAPPARIELSYGQSFNFNIDGTYHTLQMLEGDQEEAFAQEEQVDDVQVDVDDEGGKFSF